MNNSNHTYPTRPLSILLATDDVETEFELSSFLGSAGYVVHRVNNVHDLDIEIGHLRIAPPSERRADIIVSDEMLHHKSTLKLFAKKHRFVHGFPVILLTSRQSPSLVSEAKRLGVCDLLSYPIEPSMLHEAIQNSIHSRWN